VTVEMGTAAQWVSAAIAALAFVMSIRALMDRTNRERLDGIKTDVSAMRTSFEKVLSDQKTSFEKAIGDQKKEFSAAMTELRQDDSRQFQRIDQLEADVTAVQVEIKHLPTRDEFHQIDVKVSRIDAKIDARFDAITQKIDTVIQQNERAQDRLAEREDRERERTQDRLAEHEDREREIHR